MDLSLLSRRLPVKQAATSSSPSSRRSRNRVQYYSTRGRGVDQLSLFPPQGRSRDNNDHSLSLERLRAELGLARERGKVLQDESARVGSERDRLAQDNQLLTARLGDANAQTEALRAQTTLLETRLQRWEQAVAPAGDSDGDGDSEDAPSGVGASPSAVTKTRASNSKLRAKVSEENRKHTRSAKNYYCVLLFLCSCERPMNAVTRFRRKWRG
jgi:hypothetical protein